MVARLNISVKVQNGQLITENGQQLETADGQIIQHSVSDGSVIKRIQQGGGAIVTIKSTKGKLIKISYTHLENMTVYQLNHELNG